uniref:Tetratricopeptide repeat-containing protein n=1 Tax=Macrostomum lignano TaxID=282301 RepID=A0A1I8FAB7_9PLAT
LNLEAKRSAAGSKRKTKLDSRKAKRERQDCILNQEEPSELNRLTTPTHSANITVEAADLHTTELPSVLQKPHRASTPNVGDLFREKRNQLHPTASSLWHLSGRSKVHCVRKLPLGHWPPLCLIQLPILTLFSAWSSAGYVRMTLPKADNVVSLHARPFIEIHEAGRIVFLAPLSRYEEFQPDISAPAATPLLHQRLFQFKASTEELISEAVLPRTRKSAAPPSGSRFEPKPYRLKLRRVAFGGEVETVFENRQDLLEAMADRPTKKPPLRLSRNRSRSSLKLHLTMPLAMRLGEGIDFSDGEDANADKNANADSSEPAGEGDESLRRLSSDSPPGSGPRFEEHLEAHAHAEPGEERTAAAAETEPQQAGATFDVEQTVKSPGLINSRRLV